MKHADYDATLYVPYHVVINASANIHRNTWAEKMPQLQAYGFPLNVNGLMIVATLIQRAVRSNILPDVEVCLDHTIVAAASALLSGQTLFQFFEGHKRLQRMEEAGPAIVTLDWVTKKIATFSEGLVFNHARRWDIMDTQFDYNQRGMANSYTSRSWDALVPDLEQYRRSDDTPAFPLRNWCTPKARVNENTSRHAAQEHSDIGDFQTVTHNFGDHNPSGSIRLLLSTSTMLPMITLSICKNHFTGKD